MAISCLGVVNKKEFVEVLICVVLGSFTHPKCFNCTGRYRFSATRAVPLAPQPRSGMTAAPSRAPIRVATWSLTRVKAMITVRRDAVRTQGRAPKGGGDQRDHEAVGSSSQLEARFQSRRGCQMRHFCQLALSTRC